MANPYELLIRMYNVGFGDCFLLTFRYKSRTRAERHVLIDFGSTAAPLKKTSQMGVVAKDIEKVTGGRLDAVIATHRHADHISGFATSKGKGPGDVIARIAAQALVIQPWTEDPKLPTGARAPRGATAKSTLKGLNAMHGRSLDAMNDVASAIARRAQTLEFSELDAEPDEEASAIAAQNVDEEAGGKLPGAKAPKGQAFVPQLGVGRGLRQRLGFLGQTNLKNLSAVRNLQNMSKRTEYLSYGAKSELGGKVLPGVKVHVLGPPTIEEHEAMLKQRHEDTVEYWQLQAAASADFWQLQAAATKVNTQKTVKKLFPRAPTTDALPKPVRWFVRKLRAVQAGQFLELVRIVDKAMNNTSLILLFEIGDKLLLFPGDAQIENWEYVLRHAKDRAKKLELLSNVEIYKVGHHGSLNATPRTLWKKFRRKPKLITLMSTRTGKHGSPKANTEVPRTTLVEELDKKTKLHSTMDLKGTGEAGLVEKIVIPL